MANLGIKGDVFVARFRHDGREYKKSLKVRERGAAKAALHLIELTLHRLHTGQLVVPEGVDAGDFVVSGGTLTTPKPAAEPTAAPPTVTVAELAAAYLLSLENPLAESYQKSQRIHLRHPQRPGPALPRHAPEPQENVPHARRLLLAVPQRSADRRRRHPAPARQAPEGSLSRYVDICPLKTEPFTPTMVGWQTIIGPIY